MRSGARGGKGHFEMPPARIAFWVATAAAGALLARSLLLGPVPFWLAIAALAAYVALVIWGVLAANHGMFADVVVSGDSQGSRLALTFDDGPHPETTRQVLAILAKYGALATFFVIGRKVERYPDVVRDIARAGHEIALHGYDHDRWYAFKPPGRVVEDIQRSQAAVRAITGHTPCWFRPPVGQLSPRTAAGVRRAGVLVAAWSARSYDGTRRATLARVRQRLESKICAGAILLLHDASEREQFVPASIEVLPELCRTIAQKGLDMVTLSELTGLRSESARAREAQQ